VADAYSGYVADVTYSGEARYDDYKPVAPRVIATPAYAPVAAATYKPLPAVGYAPAPAYKPLPALGYAPAPAYAAKPAYGPAPYRPAPY